MGVGGQRHASAALPPGRTRHKLYRRLSGPQGQSGHVRKISPPTWFDPRTVQPLTSSYTDWAIPAHSARTFEHKCVWSNMLFFSIVGLHGLFYYSALTVICTGYGGITRNRAAGKIALHLKQLILFCTDKLMRSGNSARLRSLVACRGNSSVSFRKRPDRLWGPISLLFSK